MKLNYLEKELTMSSFLYRLFLDACYKGNLQIVRDTISRYNFSKCPEWLNGYKPLCLAVKNKQKEIVKLLLQSGAKVNNVSYRKASKNTPLHLATCNKDIEVVKMLLKFGAAVNAKNNLKRTSLHLAVMYDDEDIVQILLDHGANVKVIDNEGKSPLYFAARNGNMKIAEILLTFGAEINSIQSSIHYNTSSMALFAAVENNNLEMVKFLLQKGADINSVRFYHLINKHKTVLHLATELDNECLMELLIQHGAKLNSSYDKNCLLHQAVRSGSEKIVKLLLKDNSKFEELDEKGYTVLHRAAKNGNVNIVKMLLNHGCDINSTSLTAATPLQIAVLKNHFEVVEILLEHGADINSRDKDNKTVVYVAIKNRNIEILDLLLKFKPKLDDDSLQLAILKEPVKSEIVLRLLNYGFVLNSINNNDSKLLHKCVVGDYTDLVEYILNHSNIKLTVNVLIRAFKNKNKDIISLLLNHGCPVRFTEKPGPVLPLYYACTNRDLDTCKLILLKGADINSKIHYNDYFLHTAVKENDEEMITLALEHGANVNLIGENNSTALHIASKNYNKEIVELLLKHNADPNMKDINGCTPLHFAVNDNNTDDNNTNDNNCDEDKKKREIIVSLLESGADINIKNNNKETVLQYAVVAENVDAVNEILKRKCDINDKNFKMAFFMAAANNRYSSKLYEITENFIKHKFFLDPRDFVRFEFTKPFLSKLKEDIRNNKYPNFYEVLNREPSPEALFEYKVLRSCVISGPVELFKPMFHRYMNINARLEDGQTLLHDVCLNGDYPCALELVMCGAKINIVDDFGRTPLHESISQHDYRIAQLLIDNGADINYADKEGFTPLHDAVMQEWDHNVKLLLYYDANLDALNNNNDSPLNLAAEFGNDHAFKILLEYGASYVSYEDVEFDNEEIDTILREHKIKELVGGLKNVNIDDLTEKDIEFRTNCEKEILKMKQIGLAGTITLYEVLVLGVKNLAWYMGNARLIEELQRHITGPNFPIYSSMLKVRYLESRKIYILRRLCGSCLENIARRRLSIFVLESLFSQASNTDLRKFVLTWISDRRLAESIYCNLFYLNF